MAKELVMTCRPFDAKEAKSLGFLNRVVTHDDLENQTRKMAEAIQQRSQTVVETTKNQIRSAAENLVSTKDEWVGELLIAVANKDTAAKAAAQEYLNKGQQ